MTTLSHGKELPDHFGLPKDIKAVTEQQWEGELKSLRMDSGYFSTSA